MSDTSNVIPIKRVIGRPMAKGFDERRNYAGRPRSFSRVEFSREMTQKYKEGYEKLVELNLQLALTSPDISVQQKCMDRAVLLAFAPASADVALDAHIADLTNFSQNSEMSVLTKEDEVEIKTFIAQKIKAKMIAEQMNKDS